MEASIVTAVGLVLVAIITGAGSWIVAKRNTSGNIDTSEAAKLWDEGTNMRRELRDEVLELKTQLKAATAAIAELNEQVRQARAETEAAREETAAARAETKAWRKQVESVSHLISLEDPPVGAEEVPNEALKEGDPNEQ